MIRYGIILSAICLCASLVLSVTYQFTHSQIEKQLDDEEGKALKDIFPDAEFKEKQLNEQKYYLVKNGGKDIGYIIKAENKGYSGLINMLVGFDLEGKIRGIKILSHTETPGLGAKITEVKQGEAKPWFLKQFEGKDAKSLELKDIQAITAATISSRAILEGVKKSVADFISKVKHG